MQLQKDICFRCQIWSCEGQAQWREMWIKSAGACWAPELSTQTNNGTKCWRFWVMMNLVVIQSYIKISTLRDPPSQSCTTKVFFTRQKTYKMGSDILHTNEHSPDMIAEDRCVPGFFQRVQRGYNHDCSRRTWLCHDKSRNQGRIPRRLFTRRRLQTDSSLTKSATFGMLIWENLGFQWGTLRCSIPQRACLQGKAGVPSFHKKS